MNNRNLLKGIALCAVALVFGLGSFRYQLGRIERPGPGFFPLLVSSILFTLGVAMVIRARFVERQPTQFNVKNITIILTSLAGFALLSHFVNMIVGIVFLVFCSSLAGSNYSLRRNTIVAAVLVGIAFAFKYGLGQQLPLI